MSKQHQTIPGEPEEAPAEMPKPEIERPADPSQPKAPEEAPNRQPEELPPNEIPKPEIQPGKTDKGMDG